MLQGQEWPGLGPGPKPLNTSALSQPDGAREGIGGTEEDQPDTPCPLVSVSLRPQRLGQV